MRGGSLAKRFRLAGTFFEFDSHGASDGRKAILVDIQKKTEHIVGENDEIEVVQVVKIFRDRVVLRDGIYEEELWLSFSQPGRTTSASGTSGGDTGMPGLVNDNAVGFGGKRVGEYSWIFSRQTLLDYYQELMDEPERLVAVFDSLKPIYDDGGKITGYQLGIEGEQEFFEATGLKEGDIIRSVNQLRMTNRRRAEFFIKQFVQNRANIFKLDIERANTKIKLDYRVR